MAKAKMVVTARQQQALKEVAGGKAQPAHRWRPGYTASAHSLPSYVRALARDGLVDLCPAPGRPSVVTVVLTSAGGEQLKRPVQKMLHGGYDGANRKSRRDRDTRALMADKDRAEAARAASGG